MRFAPVHPTAGRRSRGVTMLGMLALAALLAVWCSIILDRSAETYRAGALLEWRLQARAAAEGVAIMLQRDPASLPGPQQLGAARVACLAREVDPRGRALVRMEVAIRPAGTGRDRLTLPFRAYFDRSGSAWKLVRLEG